MSNAEPIRDRLKRERIAKGFFLFSARIKVRVRLLNFTLVPLSGTGTGCPLLTRGDDCIGKIEAIYCLVVFL